VAVVSFNYKHLKFLNACGQLDSLSFFVLDEADRMVEKGHFQELQSIMSMLPIGKNNTVEGTGDDSLLTSAGEDAKKIIRRQNFVFSATLTLPTGFRNKLKKGRLQVKNKQNNDGSSVASLSEKAGIRPNAAIIDLTSKKIIAGAVQESLIQYVFLFICIFIMYS
jgi:ATP-dependent RNA helicase DDX24/MAK5